MKTTKATPWAEAEGARDINVPVIGTFIATITVKEPRPIYGGGSMPIGTEVENMLRASIESAGSEALVTAVTVELNEDFASDYRDMVLAAKRSQ